MTDDITAKARAAGRHIGPDARVLGTVDLTTGSPARGVDDEQLAAKARELLREEIARVARMREQLAVEEAAGAPGRSAERLAGMTATVEGATRFAIRLGLLSPGEARVLWTEARAAGLRDGLDAPAAAPGDEGSGDPAYRPGATRQEEGNG